MKAFFFNIKKKAKHKINVNVKNAIHKMNVNLIALATMVEFRSLNKPWYVYCKTG